MSVSVSSPALPFGFRGSGISSDTFFSLSRQYCRDDLAISRAVERFYDEMDSGHSDTGNNKMKATPDDWVATELSAAM